MKTDMEKQVDAVFTRPGQIICSECYYYYEQSTPFCAHPHARVVTLTWKGKETTSIPPSTRNRHNDCQDFREQTLWNEAHNNLALFSVLMVLLSSAIALLYAAGYGLYSWLFT